MLPLDVLEDMAVEKFWSPYDAMRAVWRERAMSTY